MNCLFIQENQSFYNHPVFYCRFRAELVFLLVFSRIVLRHRLWPTERNQFYWNNVLSFANSLKLNKNSTRTQKWRPMFFKLSNVSWVLPPSINQPINHSIFKITKLSSALIYVGNISINTSGQCHCSILHINCHRFKFWHFINGPEKECHR